jgi:hypothetical protein
MRAQGTQPRFPQGVVWLNIVRAGEGPRPECTDNCVTCRVWHTHDSLAFVGGSEQMFVNFRNPLVSMFLQLAPPPNGKRLQEKFVGPAKVEKWVASRRDYETLCLADFPTSVERWKGESNLKTFVAWDTWKETPIYLPFQGNGNTLFADLCKHIPSPVSCLCWVGVNGVHPVRVCVLSSSTSG